MKTAATFLAVIGAAVAAGAQGTGYPACDKYISMVTACINTKVPPAERADRQQQLDGFRDMLKGFLAPSIAPRCEENVRLEIQRDQYGCYAAEAATAGLRTPCSLLVPGELAAVLDVTFAPGRAGNSACEYDAPRSPSRLVRLEVAWNGGRDRMQAWRDGVEIVYQQVRKSLGQTAPLSRENVSGLGDDAFLVVAGFTPMIAARKGDVAVSVRAQGATRDQLIAVLRSALARVP
jgi:hypothetical protein